MELDQSTAAARYRLDAMASPGIPGQLTSIWHPRHTATINGFEPSSWQESGHTGPILMAVENLCETPGRTTPADCAAPLQMTLYAVSESADVDSSRAIGRLQS